MTATAVTGPPDTKPGSRSRRAPYIHPSPEKAVLMSMCTCVCLPVSAHSHLYVRFSPCRIPLACKLLASLCITAVLLEVS